VVVDPLAPGIDLAPFFKLMNDKKVLKVFHAARQDIEITWTLAKCIPNPLFDTQVAAMVCGYGDSVSYEQLANDLAKARIDKSSRFTDWARRPLSEAQLVYAVADVTHLRDVYSALKAQLEGNGRTGWLDEEMAVLTSESTYRLEPEDAWERFRGRLRKPREVAVMIEVAAWREREARSRDVPRARVLKDDAMIDLALRAPKTEQAMAELRSIPRGFERSRAGQDLLEAIGRGLARDSATIPKIDRHRTRPGNGSTTELLKVLLKLVAEETGVAPKILATIDELEAIAGGDAKAPPLQGWRKEIFGDKAMALKAGKLSLTLEGHKVVAKPVGPA
jgi:ribonuclease D